MRPAARVLAGVIALLYLAFGVRFLFFPESALQTAGLDAGGLLGLANTRALLGGSFAAFGVLLIMHTVVHQQTGALRFAILHLLLTLVGRVVGLGVDGVDPLVLRNLIPVSVMIAVSVISLRLFLKTEPAPA